MANARVAETVLLGAELIVGAGGEVARTAGVAGPVLPGARLILCATARKVGTAAAGFPGAGLALRAAGAKVGAARVVFPWTALAMWTGEGVAGLAATVVPCAELTLCTGGRVAGVAGMVFPRAELAVCEGGGGSMKLVSIVTAPFRASALPHAMLAVVFSVMLVRARMFPANTVLVPRVAELPTSQYTLSAPPLMKRMRELLAVVSVLPIWKSKRAAGLPRSLRVSVPVSCAALSK